MVTLVNRAKVNTTTTGTGTINLGSAVDGYQTFADAGVVNTNVVRYTIEDGEAWEIGSGTYSSGTLTRSLDESSTGSLLNLSGEAVVYVTATGSDLLQPSDIGSTVQGYDANIVSDASYVHTDNNYTTTEKNKLAGIEAGATGDQSASEILTAVKTVDGSGSGLDADTVDGVHADALKQAVNATALTSSDSIDSVTDGWYRWHSSGPTGAYADYMVMVQSTDGAQPTQLTFGTTNHIIAVRRKDSGTWSSWAKMWSNENDGAGSGLDADLLDGQHGSYYLDWTNTTNKPDPTLTLNGDVSGSATFTNLGNATLSVTVADDSHNHVISNVDGLQTALDGKLSTSGKAADSDLLDGIDSSSFSRYDANGTLSNALANQAWVSSYSGSTNVDHVWHDDGANAWNFNSDSTFKATANSRVNAGSFYAGGNVVWNAGNDGSGSGLDADTVDGVQGSSFLRSDTTDTATSAIYFSGGLSAEAENKEDITTRTASGFWQTSTATTAEGWPTTSDTWYHLLSSTHSNSENYYSMQFAGSFYNSNDIYYRSTAGSGTTAWAKLWNSSNDGSGSGLDADTVDGLQASQFIRSDATDTATGVITFSDRIQAHEIRTNTNQELILNAGESASYATGQTGEYVYVNAEQGLQINTSPDNWSSGWAGRDTFTFSSSGMQFPDGTTQTTAAPADEQDYGLITGSITTTNDYGALT